MEGKVTINLGASTFILLAALGLIEAWRLGVPWYIGVGVGIVLAFLTSVGIIPIVGQVVYYLIGRYLLVSVLGVWFSLTFWVGFLISIGVSVIIGFFLLLIKKRIMI